MATRSRAIFRRAGGVMAQFLDLGTQICGAAEMASHAIIGRATLRVVMVHYFGQPIRGPRNDSDRWEREGSVASSAIIVGSSTYDCRRDVVGNFGYGTKNPLIDIRTIVATVATPGDDRVFHRVLGRGTADAGSRDRRPYAEVDGREAVIG